MANYPKDRKRKSPEERFSAKTLKTEACWLWQGYKQRDGYGVFCLTKHKEVMAHRWAYTHSKGAIPAGMEIDHVCSVRNCVNPAHLEAVTHAANVQRGVARGGYSVHHKLLGALNAVKTHCKNGHPYSGDNLRIDASSGARRCRICDREKVNKYRLKLLQEQH